MRNRWVLLVALLWGAQEGYGQDQIRKYATRQHDFSVALIGLGGSVENPGYVINADPKTGSQLKFLVGALGLTYAEQVVDFNPNPNATDAANSPTFSAGTPITVKLSLPK